MNMILMEIAKWIVAVIAVYNFGGVLYDAIIPKTAKMHLYNAAWPPHAKFHNAQTMMLGMSRPSEIHAYQSLEPV